MPIVLYYLVGSPPCGFIWSLAKEIGVQVCLKELDFAKKEHLGEDFLKLNPFHKVPTIDDDGFVVYESNAIAYYLLRRYAPGSVLYPTCVKERTRIDQVLACASCNIHPDLATFLRPRVFDSTKPTAEEVTALEKNVIKGIENLIGDGKFAVGDKLTIADLCLIGHVVLALENGSVNKDNYPKLAGYYEHVKSELPYFDQVYGPAIDSAKRVWARLK
ncbi:glutathione S-transferase 1-1-like [Amblyomma americanum]